MIATSGNLGSASLRCLDLLNEFQSIYLGVLDSDPLNPVVGSLYFNSIEHTLKAFNGAMWVAVGETTVISNTEIVSVLPATANIGDLVVNMIDGGVYEWKIDIGGTVPSWVLIAQSAGTSGGGGDGTYVPPVVPSDGYPTLAPNGTLVYNVADGTFGAFINGEWKWLNSTPSATDVVGIEVLITDPTTGNFEGRTIFNTTEMKLKMFTAGVWLQVVEPTTAAATVADGSLTTAAFASSIRPVEIVSSLPTTGNALGRIVYLTTDGQAYRYTASGWSNAVPAQAITGTLGSTQIAPNAITTEKLAVGAVTADTIAANAIVTSHIGALQITAGTIAVGAIGATQIAANAITADKVNAGAITAGKIAALSIDATKIVAGSIGADQLSANSITAGKVAAGAISGNHIAANTIVGGHIAASTIHAGHLAAYTITADKIQTGSITLDKLTSSSTVANGVTFGIGNGSSIAGYTAGGFFTASSADKFGLIVGNSNGTALGVGSANTTGVNATAIFVNSYNSSYTSHRTTAALAEANVAATFRNNVSGTGMLLAGPTYAWMTSSGISGSFTGGHDGLLLKTELMPELGDIMVDKSIYAVKNMDDSMCINTVSSIANQKNVVGVFNGKAHSSHVPTSVSMSVERDDGTFDNIVDTAKYADFNDYYMIVVSAIGEGLVNVCGANGNIEAGDLIVSSAYKGKGMKQEDDIVRSCTVAKARESVVFDSPEQVKQIACIYMCG